jgi:hypothetical protein
VQVYNINICYTIVDEGASVSILSSTTWQALGFPQLVPVNHNLLYFDIRASESLGILPQLPITLGGKIIHIDVMIAQGPLDFNLLLGRDYVYSMKSIVSTLFRVMSFPHNGNIMTIYQLSFIGRHMMTNLLTSLNIPNIAVSTPPQVNYVSTCPVFSIVDENEPLTICSTSSDLDPIVDMVISSIGILMPNIPTPIATLDMYSF